MIKPAQIQWSNGSPVSTQFDDVYFSKLSGIEETRYVFLEHSHLPERWKTLSNNCFTIAETGFGTGLNLLCAWKSWLSNSRLEQTLHFVSVEKFPLSKDALQQALRQWPELESLSQGLIDVYPPLVPGWHPVTLPKLSENSGNVVLHLFFGDINHWLNQIQGTVDAWFLDGFAPSKNPEMWSEHLFHSMARLSNRLTSVATFTAAGLVNRGLQAAGFTTKKAKGFGKKREMLTAQYTQNQGPCPLNWLRDKPWNALPTYTKPSQTQPHVVIIGAGIAGCASAYSMAKRGWRVSLLDQHENIASGASGNAQGVLYAKLSSDMNIQSEFYLAGYLYSLQLLKQTMPEKTNWNNCGVLQLAFSEKELKRQQQFYQRFELDDVLQWVDASHASKLANTELNYGGLHFKQGAWVHPKAWCEALTAHKNIHFFPNHKVQAITRNKKQWQVCVEEGSSEIQCDAVIVCSAFDANKITELSFLPTQPIAGQVSQASHSPSTLSMVLCGDSYVTPNHNNALNFGATYRLKSDTTNETEEDHQFNLEKLNDNFPSVSSSINGPLAGRVSVRCSTPDYTPIVGAICDEAAFKAQFCDLKKSKKWRFYESAPYLSGLYVNIGHGSRGLSSAPLSADMLAAQINNEVLPMCKRHVDMLNPNRFLVSQTIKGQ
ncbi:bifunctional tRNA (5-methylaminomethyl-2-thiouridine)(34)-methyltransferase MnmD/FAD-dependent 5-carboxymethylaminomethyl-2-thiouridine(34) oxidoreductase MnmC [Oceaniserpentilla sp. 4NH20-0058]|uniref:bifunctional tRNA (5-methylaminomethyl-2-thiouridine)(34)-methyltransferase MnmD/FAD-dependent 5-carboxymethylaminomethyl-2-thiouridine(34) oxidoreductase MnmC n=1 Tax=Oceaniserpentilla sp. 4NH20-0058 TaxID=3127660 RepID=UPI003106D6D2